MRRPCPVEFRYLIKTAFPWPTPKGVSGPQFVMGIRALFSVSSISNRSTMTASTARYALPADLKALEPLHDLLGALPAVFPTEDDRRIRPLAIGIDKYLVAMALARGADADQAAAVVR
jgi:hypothetical protein